MADFENLFAWISDSKRDFNGFPDPATAVDCEFIHFWAQILDFARNKSIFASDSGKILTEDLVNKSQRIRGFAHTDTAHGFCITYLLENNAFSVLNYIINVALHYYMLELSQMVLLGCCLTASCLHEAARWQ